jgi:hypothetical protein
MPRNNAITTSSRPGSQHWTPEEQDDWILCKITQAQLFMPGSPVLDPIALDKFLDLHLELLHLVGKERFEQAYDFCLKTSKFRPAVSELYAAAGISLQPPVEAEALAELRRIIEAMRFHGPKMKPKHSKLIRDRDGEGRMLTNPEYEIINPPKLSPVVLAALADLGFGDIYEGFDVIARHPAVAKAPVELDPTEHSFRNRDARDIEKQWMEAFKQARTSTQRS